MDSSAKELYLYASGKLEYKKYEERKTIDIAVKR